MDDDEGSLDEPLLEPRKGIKRVQTFDQNGGHLDVYARSFISGSLPDLVGHMEEEHAAPSPSAAEDSNFAGTTVSLSKVILGSGMLVRFPSRMASDAP